ncbi:MAG: FeoC-like transcriptional regulator [Cyanobacteria bacterium J06597_16]
MICDIQAYISARGTVSITDLSLRFHTDSNTLRPMLSKLSRKGRIRALPLPSKCAHCTCCNVQDLAGYEWVGTQRL